LDLGAAPLGESSGEGTFTLTNLGQQTSGPIHLASTSGDFVIGTTGVGTCVSDTTTLAHNASCTVRVVLTPTSLGAKSAFITFEATPGNSGHVAVSGTGTAGAALSVGTTTTVSFPLGTVGVAGPVSAFTVTNVGPRTSGALSATSNDADFAVQTGTAGDCSGATLAPSATCTVRVVLTPSLSGSLSGTISVAASPGGTVSVTASGSSCSVIAHDDGTGACVPLDTCAANYHIGGARNCVPNKTCPTGQLSDDTGTCVPMVGVTWLNRGIQADSVAISADGKRLIAVARGTTAVDGLSHVYTSTNGGQDWVERTLPTAEEWSGVASSADGANLVVVGPSSIYASTDGGGTWTFKSTGWALTSRLASSAGGTTLVGGFDGGHRVSRDMGVTWSSYGSYSAQAVTTVAVSADGTKIYLEDGDGYFCASSNSGQSWSCQLSSFVYSIVCSADGSKVLADKECTWSGSGGGFDCGGHASTTAFAGSASLRVLLASDRTTAALLSTDSGATWKPGDPPGGGTFAAVSANGTTLVVITPQDYGVLASLYTSTGPVP
jgi:hypothetical protein